MATAIDFGLLAYLGSGAAGGYRYVLKSAGFREADFRGFELETRRLGLEFAERDRVWVVTNEDGLVRSSVSWPTGTDWKGRLVCSSALVVFHGGEDVAEALARIWQSLDEHRSKSATSEPAVVATEMSSVKTRVRSCITSRYVVISELNEVIIVRQLMARIAARICAGARVVIIDSRRRADVEAPYEWMTIADLTRWYEQVCVAPGSRYEERRSPAPAEITPSPSDVIASPSDVTIPSSPEIVSPLDVKEPSSDIFETQSDAKVPSAGLSPPPPNNVVSMENVTAPASDVTALAVDLSLPTVPERNLEAPQERLATESRAFSPEGSRPEGTVSKNNLGDHLRPYERDLDRVLGRRRALRDPIYAANEKLSRQPYDHEGIARFFLCWLRYHIASIEGHNIGEIRQLLAPITGGDALSSFNALIAFLRWASPVASHAESEFADELQGFGMIVASEIAREYLQRLLA